MDIRTGSGRVTQWMVINMESIMMMRKGSTTGKVVKQEKLLNRKLKKRTNGQALWATQWNCL